MAFFSFQKWNFFEEKSVIPCLNSTYVYESKSRMKGGAYLSHFSTSSLREIKIDRIKIKIKS